MSIKVKINYCGGSGVAVEIGNLRPGIKCTGQSKHYQYAFVQIFHKVDFTDEIIELVGLIKGLFINKVIKTFLYKKILTIFLAYLICITMLKTQNATDVGECSVFFCDPGK